MLGCNLKGESSSEPRDRLYTNILELTGLCQRPDMKAAMAFSSQLTTRARSSRAVFQERTC